MKTSLLLSASCTALLALSSAAYAYTPYLSFNAGVGIPGDADANLLGQSVTLEADPGFALSGAWGCDLGIMRFEAALAYQENDLDKLQLHNAGFSVNPSGTTDSMAGTINGYYQFLNHTPLTPFVMAGIGYGKVEVKDFEVLGQKFGDSDDTSFIYQVGAGCSYAINPRVAFDLQYRYVDAPDIELDLTGSGNTQDVDCATNNIYAGLRFKF